MQADGLEAAADRGDDPDQERTLPDGDSSPDSGRPDDAGAHRGVRWWREVVYIIVIYTAYSVVRNIFGSGDGGMSTAEPAYRNAVRVIDVQGWFGLNFEADVQEWYLDLPSNGLIRLWNVFYGIAHFVVTTAVLVWLFRARGRYRIWRNTLALTTMLALAGFATFSLMPPRLMDDPGLYGGCQVYAEGQDLPTEAGESPCDDYGFVDTIDAYGGWASFGSEEMAQVSNQFAAMPSMHIGWSTWCALVAFSLTRRRWARGLAAAYPLLTLFVIIVTGNHFWLDAVGGIVCLSVGFLIAYAATVRWERSRLPTPELPG
jgi:hypothetical protein